METFANSCRLCLWKGDKMLPIFVTPDDNETASKIRKCLPLDVRWEDSLPKGICANCMYKVEMLYEFHCCSVRVDSLLRKYLSSELKDVTIKKQQLNGSGYQMTGGQTMRSVAIGTEDEYVPSTRIRECGESSNGTLPAVPRVRVLTPFDISNMNSVSTGPTASLPLRQLDRQGTDGCTAAVSSLAHRSDGAQGNDGVAVRAVGGTEQSAAGSRVLCFSPASGGAARQGDPGQPEPEGGAGVAGDARTTGDTDVVCLSVRSPGNAMQNDPPTPRPCECGNADSDDDDEVVVLGEYQRPRPQPSRHCRPNTPFPADGSQRPPRRLCRRHQEAVLQQVLKQRGLALQETQKGADQLPQRTTMQVPVASTSSTNLTSSGASGREQSDANQKATQDQSSGEGTRHIVAETPSIGTSSNSSRAEEHVQSPAQRKPACDATGSSATRTSSELSRNTDRPSQPERECNVARTEHRGAITGTPLHNSSVPEPQDRARQTTTQTKPCGKPSSSADVVPRAAAVTSAPPLAAPLRATPAVPPPPPATTPIPGPPSPAVPTPSTTLTTPSEQTASARLPKKPVPISSAVPPGTPVTTQSAATPVIIPVVTQPTVTSHSGRNTTHTLSPVRSPPGGQPPPSSDAQTSSAQKRTHPRSKSKSPTAGRGRNSRSNVTTMMCRLSKSSTPSPTHTSVPLAPLNKSVPWPVSTALTSPSSLSRVSAQPPQQETRQQRVLLPACDSAHPEHQVLQGKLQDEIFKFPTFLVVTNASIHPQTQPEQQGNVPQVLQNVSPGTGATNLSTQPSTTPQTPTVSKEEEEKRESQQTVSPGGAIGQLIAASALVSPPRGLTETQQVKKPGDVQTKSPEQLVATRSTTAPLHSCTQLELHKNRQQVPRDRLSENTGQQSAASPIDTEGEGVSAQNGETLSGADWQSTDVTAATPHTVAQSNKRKKDHLSHSVIAGLPASPLEDVAASPTAEQSKHSRQKYRRTHSPTKKNLLKSTEIAEKDRQTPPVPKSQQSGGTVDLHQAAEPPALKDSDFSLKWKKKKKKKEKEEGSHHRSSHKYQQEQLAHKRNQPGDLPPQSASTPSPQQNQETETASLHSGSQSQSVAKYELSGAEVIQPQVERWRNVQQDAVERVRSAVREGAQQPQAPLHDPATSLPVPSSTAKTPPPPTLTPQRPPSEPELPTSPSPTPPVLPPAVSASASADSPQSACLLPQCAGPPLSDESPPTHFLTPPDGADRQKSRSQPQPKAAAEVCERRLRTPSPAASSSSADWPSVSLRSGTSPRRYYNRKRRHSDAGTGQTSGASTGAGRDAVNSAEKTRSVTPSLCSTPRPPSVHLNQTGVARMELRQVSPNAARRSLTGIPLPPPRSPSATPLPPPRSPVETPLPSPRTVRAFRYSCRYCRQRFRAGILLSLHYVNGACELHRSHDYAFSGGGGDRLQVTEQELMLAARVRLERLYVCPRCSRVLSDENTFKWHLAFRHCNPHDTRSSLQARWHASTPPPPEVLPPLPLLLPLTGKSAESKDTVLEALGLTRKT